MRDPEKSQVIYTPEGAENVMRLLMCSTRRMLVKAAGIVDDQAETSDETGGAAQAFAEQAARTKKTVDFAEEDFAGYCGLAQSFVDHIVKATGVGVPEPFALQTLPRAFGHVALTVEMQTTEGRKSYLADPSFWQFCAWYTPEVQNLLSQQPEGERIVGALIDEGFVERTFTRGESYLTAMNGGRKPFRSEEKTEAFFVRPHKSGLNLWFSSRQMEKLGVLSEEILEPLIPLVRSFPAAAAPHPAPHRSEYRQHRRV